MSEHTYDYRVKSVERVIDGDTYDLCLDLGFFDYVVKRIRLKDIDTFEVFGKNASVQGQEAREFAEQWMADPERDLRMTSFVDPERTNPLPDGAFGRWVGDVYDVHTGEHLNDALREAGFADE